MVTLHNSLSRTGGAGSLCRTIPRGDMGRLRRFHGMHHAPGGRLLQHRFRMAGAGSEGHRALLFLVVQRDLLDQPHMGDAKGPEEHSGGTGQATQARRPTGTGATLEQDHRTGKPLIELETVSRVFPRTRVSALREVSIELGPAEHVAVTGPSGSGKSTLLNL